MQLSTLPLTALLSLTLSIAVPGDGTRAELERALTAVHELMDHRQWDAARGRIAELVGAHGEAEYFQPHLEAVRQDLARCAFWAARSEPDWSALVSGRLHFYSPRTGQVKVAYGPTQLGDFRPFSPGDDERRIVHPVSFDGSYGVELSGSLHPPAVDGQPTPTVWVCVGKGDGFAVVFGVAGADPETPGRPAVVYRVRGQEVEELVRAESPVRAGRRFRLSVDVSPSQITASYDGRRFLRAKKPRELFGQVALEGCDGFDQLVLQGRARSSWLRGLADTAIQREWVEFQRTWQPTVALPGKSFGDVEPPSAAASVDVSAGILRARELVDRGHRGAAVEAYAGLLELRPDLPLLYDEQAELLLLAGRHADVPELLQRARRGSVWTPRLGSVERILVKSIRGPEWAATHRVETSHFVVSSDLDRASCELVARELEEGLRWFDARLHRLSLAGRPRFRAFLFAGEAGYRVYAEEVFRSPAENTNGCYSPSLKQVLVWNLPDRDELLRTARHEVFHQCLDHLMAAPPTWFNEGLAEDYEVTGTSRAARPVTESQADHLRVLAVPDAWLSLEELLRLSPEEFYAENPARNYAQSWALVHWLRHGGRENEALFRRLFDAFVERGASLHTQEEVLADVDLPELERALRDWVAGL